MTAHQFEHRSLTAMTLLLPDLECAGPGYWMHDWVESRFDCRPVDLGHARRPDRNSLVTWLDHALRGIEAPVVLVGHGVGALTIAAWAGLMSSESEASVIGALLIAPNDPLGADADPRLQDFPLPPSTIFSFPALVVASDNDPMLSPERAFSLARQWGAGFARFGPCGHFSPQDRLGAWPDGEALLDRFIALVEPDRMKTLGRLDELADGLSHSHRSVAARFRP